MGNWGWDLMLLAPCSLPQSESLLKVSPPTWGSHWTGIKEAIWFTLLEWNFFHSVVSLTWIKGWTSSLRADVQSFPELALVRMSLGLCEASSERLTATPMFSLIWAFVSPNASLQLITNFTNVISQAVLHSSFRIQPAPIFKIYISMAWYVSMTSECEISYPWKGKSDLEDPSLLGRLDWTSLSSPTPSASF